MYWSDCTLRLISGKPWPGAGGLAGRGPFGGLLLDLAGDGDAFLLKGFSLQIRLWLAVSGLGAVDPFVLRLVWGVAGAELAYEGTWGGQGLREARWSFEEDTVELSGVEIEGSDVLLVIVCSWSLLAPPADRCSELDERLSVLRAGEAEQEEGSEGDRTWLEVGGGGGTRGAGRFLPFAAAGLSDRDVRPRLGEVSVAGDSAARLMLYQG